MPPAPELVPGLVADLLVYLNGAQHSPLVQAALVHAQFETIHPFTDGNGRVGRALIQTVLARRGLTPTAVLPVSLVLGTFREDYVRGLTRFREYRSGEDAPLLEWIGEFVSAVEAAAKQASVLAESLSELRAEWDGRIAALHLERGRKRAMRADSTTAQILARLPGTPVLTVKTAARIHGVSTVAATDALQELVDAGVLHRRRVGRTSAFTADDVLDLVPVTESRLASTREGATSSYVSLPWVWGLLPQEGRGACTCRSEGR